MQKNTSVEKKHNGYAQLKILFFLLAFFPALIAHGQQKLIPLYTDSAPGSENWTWDEKEFFVKVPLNAKVLYNISKPTLTVFRPEHPNGCALIISPGGGYRILNFEKEGARYANQLVKKGITVFVLKYRLIQSITDDPWQETMAALRNPDSMQIRKFEAAIEMARVDLNAAIRYVRKHATELKIDSTRIGLLGFSSGGSMTAYVAYNFMADARPAFVAPIYSVITRIKERNVQPDAPPMFIAAATDDQFAPVSNSIDLYNDWLKAKRPAELHVYSKGGHGLNGLPAANWINRFEEWLDANGFLKQ